MDDLLQRMRDAVPPGYHGHILDEAADRLEAALRLAAEVRTLNPEAGELGEGKARNLIALAERVAAA